VGTRTVGSPLTAACTSDRRARPSSNVQSASVWPFPTRSGCTGAPLRATTSARGVGGLPWPCGSPDRRLHRVRGRDDGDSQPIEALDGQTRLLGQPGRRHTRNPSLARAAGGFRGFPGYVGTETIGGKATRDWLDSFGARHPSESLADYAHAFGQELTDEWQRLGLASVLEILISGFENGDVRFWFVRNSQGLYEDGTYRAPKAEFDAVNDLDVNYVPNDLRPGQTKEELLRERIYSSKRGCRGADASLLDRAYNGGLLGQAHVGGT
jgi:hypothetical protein